MAEARNAAGDDSEHDHDANAGYESEAMAVLEAIALNSRAGADPQHRQPLEPAVPGRARGRRGAVRRRPRRPGADGDGPGPRARAGAGGDDEGRRAHDDRRGAAGLARARGQGALAAPAGAVGDHGARDLRRLPRAAARAAGGVPREPVDLACAEPAFLDLTLAGLDAIPGPGEERLATDFLRSPGGGAITAVGAARLGLSSALVSPLGDDAVGILLRSLLADDGVRWSGRLVDRSPVTVIMPADGDRAMATFDPGEGVTAAELAAVEPRAVVLSIPRLPLAPAGARVYVVGRRRRRAGARRRRAARRARAARGRCWSTSARRGC